MTLTTDAPTTALTPTWTLSELARGQLAACGIALSEVYRVLRQPQLTTPRPAGGVKHTGYGLCVSVDDRDITAIEIDGASSENWSDWARERAQFGDGDVASADALVATDLAAVHRREVFERTARRQRPVPAQAGPLVRSHVLDSIHPALRDEITRQVDGDFSRLVVHSNTKVTILPAD